MLNRFSKKNLSNFLKITQEMQAETKRVGTC